MLLELGNLLLELRILALKLGCLLELWVSSRKSRLHGVLETLAPLCHDGSRERCDVRRSQLTNYFT
jgi:hypothetical protein